MEKKCLEGTKELKNYSQEQRFSPLACTPLRKFLATPLIRLYRKNVSLGVLYENKVALSLFWYALRKSHLIFQSTITWLIVFHRIFLSYLLCRNNLTFIRRSILSNCVIVVGRINSGRFFFMKSNETNLSSANCKYFMFLFFA